MKRALFICYVFLGILCFTSCQQETNTQEINSSEFNEKTLKSLQQLHLNLSDFIEDPINNSALEKASKRYGSHVMQKSVIIDGQKIAYLETTGKGPNVFMVHGTTQSSRAFNKQLYSILGKVFHIVSIDLAGHGNSDDFTTPSNYQIPGHSDLLVKVVEKLGMQESVFVGWSLGGTVILESIDALKDATSFLTFGTVPLSIPFTPAGFKPIPESGLAFQENLSAIEKEKLIKTLFKPNANNIPEFFYTNLDRQDAFARVFLGVSIGTTNYKNQTKAISELTKPLAIFSGTEDQTVNVEYLKSLDAPSLWYNQVIEIPNAGHSPQWENPFHFNVLLAAFIIDSYYFN